MPRRLAFLAVLMVALALGGLGWGMLDARGDAEDAKDEASDAATANRTRIAQLEEQVRSLGAVPVPPPPAPPATTTTAQRRSTATTARPRTTSTTTAKSATTTAPEPPEAPTTTTTAAPPPPTTTTTVPPCAVEALPPALCVRPGSTGRGSR